MLFSRFIQKDHPFSTKRVLRVARSVTGDCIIFCENRRIMSVKNRQH